MTNPFFTAGTGLGEASGLPQIEARATYAMGKLLGINVTGHWNSVDPSNLGAGPTGVCGTTGTTPKGTAAGCDNKTVYAVGLNFRLNLQPFILQGGGFTGQNTSPLLGEIVQFPDLGAGDVSDWGAWAQAGFMLTKELGVYAFAGTEHPDPDAAKAAGMFNLGRDRDPG